MKVIFIIKHAFIYIRSVLRDVQPQPYYAVGLAYISGKQNEYDDCSDTMRPEGIESVHPHYALSEVTTGCSGR